LLLALALPLILLPRFIIGYWTAWTFVLEAAGCTILVALAAYGPDTRLMRLLDAPPVRFLGRVSLGFYLYHPLVMNLISLPLFSLLGGTGLLARAPLAMGIVVALLSIPPALAVAALSYRLIERPAIALGRRLEPALHGRIQRSAPLPVPPA
jgi:peptidoglycan/LPS O-acetylase OafA/YrhL